MYRPQGRYIYPFAWYYISEKKIETNDMTEMNCLRLQIPSDPFAGEVRWLLAVNVWISSEKGGKVSFGSWEGQSRESHSTALPITSIVSLQSIASSEEHPVCEYDHPINSETSSFPSQSPEPEASNDWRWSRG